MTRCLGLACKAPEAVIALPLAAMRVPVFGSVVRGEAEPLVSARDGLAKLRVTGAIIETSRNGRAVALAPA